MRKQRNILIQSGRGGTSCLVIILVLFGIRSAGQNYFDAEHTRKFAAFLFNSKQYEYAGQEYERLCFLEPTNDSAKQKVVASYRLSGEFGKGIRCIESFFPDKCNMLQPFSKEYIRLILLSENFDKSIRFLDSCTVFSEGEKTELLLKTMVLKSEWNSADNLINSLKDTLKPDIRELNLLIRQQGEIRYKSKLLASGLSTVLPGAGKVYTGNAKDGLIVLLLVTANAYQAYRGFEKQGIKSTYGWIFGSLSACFYLGDIWGSYKAAKKYNEQKNSTIHEKAKAAIYDSF